MKSILSLLFLFFCGISYSQTTISGVVTDENSQPIPGANVIIVGTSTGTVTDFDGNFFLTVSQEPPFTLQASSVGFSTVNQEVTANNQTLNFILKEGTSLDEVVISASRTPERIFESPVTVERFGLKEIKNTASADFYNGLENLKGVDINTNSLTFNSINTRGFAAFSNTRFMQLVDGMDNSTPALNFPIGNLVGMIETDVQSVELLPGAASALYGANAFNGILFMRSKSPFDVQGISGYYKQGITSQDAAGDNTYRDLGIRLAHKFSDKFAAKVNFGWLKGTDWYATNYQGKPGTGDTRASLNYDGYNIYGDEVSTNIRSASGGLGIIPDVVVSRTGYEERDLTDYNAESIKADWGLYYRPWANDFEIAYVGKVGTGSTIYQGSNRYSIDNFFQQQHKIEVRNDNFFLRGYIVADKAGDSYDMTMTGIQINRAWKSDEQWFGDYINTFAAATIGGATEDQAHDLARQAAESGRYEPGSPEFKAAFNKSINDPQLVTGSKFQDASKYYHADGNYNFSHLWDVLEVQLGGSFRKYDLNSSGTIYTDYDGSIPYSEYGIYTQLQKQFDLNEDLELKLTGSARFDKSEFYSGFVSPRISAGLTINRNHNIRASFQTGFRNPTTQDLFIGLDAGPYVLVGSAPSNLDRYTRDYAVSASGQQNGHPAIINQTGGAAYTNSYSSSSVTAYLASGNSPGTRDASLLKVGNPDIVKPEQVSSMEIGYRGKLNPLTIDLSVYYNKYKDFISNENVVAPLYGVAGDNGVSLDAINFKDYQSYQTYTNSDVDVKSFGGSIGLSMKVFNGFDLNGSYTYAKEDFDQEANPDFRTSFNTPEHKVKVGFGHTEVFKNFGFNLAWKWSDDYKWEATFGDGDIPAFHSLDAQISYTVPKIKSVFKLGASNAFGEEYYSAIGTGSIGSIYYVSWTLNNL
ncbi:TonB-dependent receptor [Xanthomarina sp. F1114]|uniref:TonB-dependent receptor n=1 Tax=Xanthomarina sp. F1114 TaxID=2996019 RepID=UPI00225DFA58|nr:TonB-dependent receptor [Xanthomarina sp. F1114]MCX7546427.1 TonB-dependent receptor [Xanthomarina sp. F1114]